MTHLSVNLDKVALVRNARGGGVPGVVEAALLAIEAGCDGLTLHPRIDERHATFGDARDLAALEAVSGGAVELNIEGDGRDELLELVLEVGASQFTLVVEEAGEITTNQGWSAGRDARLLRRVAERLRGRARLSLFIDPELDAVELAAGAGFDAVEFHTAAYAAAHGTPEADGELDRIAAGAELARAKGLRVHCGHDLDLDNLGPLMQRVRPDEVSIGHALISAAMLVGLPGIVRSYKRITASEE